MNLANNKFSANIIRSLKYYVYLYTHPINGEIFYIGKGKGNRVFAHLEDLKESKKVQYIRELKKQGLVPKIEILVHGLEDEVTALRVESSVIDLLGIQNLTNLQAGYKSATFGRMTLDQINAAYDKRKIEITEPSILIRISQAFRYSMDAMELYDYTRGQWRLNPERARLTQYGFAIYEGIIQEVYEIVDWFEAGSTFSVRQNNEHIDRGALDRQKGRFEFVGNLAPDNLRKKYRYKSVDHYFKKGNSNPIMYLNLD